MRQDKCSSIKKEQQEQIRKYYLNQFDTLIAELPIPQNKLNKETFSNNKQTNNKVNFKKMIKIDNKKLVNKNFSDRLNFNNQTPSKNTGKVEQNQEHSNSGQTIQEQSIIYKWDEKNTLPSKLQEYQIRQSFNPKRGLSNKNPHLESLKQDDFIDVTNLKLKKIENPTNYQQNEAQKTNFLSSSQPQKINLNKKFMLNKFQFDEDTYIKTNSQNLNMEFHKNKKNVIGLQPSNENLIFQTNEQISSFSNRLKDLRETFNQGQSEQIKEYMNNQYQNQPNDEQNIDNIQKQSLQLLVKIKKQLTQKIKLPFQQQLKQLSQIMQDYPFLKETKESCLQLLKYRQELREKQKRQNLQLSFYLNNIKQVRKISNQYPRSKQYEILSLIRRISIKF